MSDAAPNTRRSTDTRVLDEVRPPRACRVLLHNDHYTTMDFVVRILMTVFHHSAAGAERIMLAVHREGIGVAGVFPPQIAETKVALVHRTAREHGYPLRCSIEPE